MPEYIDRQKLLKALSYEGTCRSKNSESPDLLRGLVIAILVAKKEVETADVVPVVRCKDCKFAAHRTANVYPAVECMRPDVSYGAVRGLDDYCSYGERKEDDDAD